MVAGWSAHGCRLECTWLQVRHVIGKAGSMIHKLEQEAGAWISIQSEREMQAEARRARKVIIKGSCEARSKAL